MLWRASRRMRSQFSFYIVENPLLEEKLGLGFFFPLSFCLFIDVSYIGFSRWSCEFLFFFSLLPFALYQPIPTPEFPASFLLFYGKHPCFTCFRTIYFQIALQDEMVTYCHILSYMEIKVKIPFSLVDKLSYPWPVF